MSVQLAPTKLSGNCLESIENQVASEDSYNIRLNGDAQRAPPWPSERTDEKMYLLPKRPASNDGIIINGTMQDNPTRVRIGLATEYVNGIEDNNNIACLVDLNFSEGKISLKPGDEELDLGNLNNGSDFMFNFSFAVNFNNEPVVNILTGDNPLGEINLNHELQSIRYLIVNGDVHSINNLIFEFNKKQT